MKKMKIIPIIFLLTSFSFSDIINITGKIVDSDGNSLNGVSVRLLKESKHVITDQDGNFNIGGSVAISNEVNSFQNFSFANNILKINSPGNEKISIDLLTLTGKKVKTYSRNLSFGNHNISLSELIGNNPGAGFYVIKANWQGAEYKQKLLSFGDNRITLVGSINKSDNILKEYKVREAILDTLEFSLSGFFVKKVPLDSYTKDLNTITIKTLKDELTIDKAFIFSETPILREDNATSDTLIYIGANFDVTTKINDVSIIWDVNTSITDKSSELNIQGDIATVIRGALTEKATPYTLTATGNVNGETQSVNFKFKVLTKQFKVMTWNIWGKHGLDFSYSYNGQQTTQRDRVAMLMKEYEPDVVGIVETYGNRPFLMQQLGYQYSTYKEDSESYLGNLSVISKYPVIKDIMFGSEHNHLGSEIKISDNRQYVFYSTWFTSGETCEWVKSPQTYSDEQGIAFDSQSRLGSAQKVINNIKSNGYDNTADSMPVIIVGDHNTISHLDYTNATAGLPQNYGRGAIANPVSLCFADNGFKDSFREVKPDPIEFPGLSHDPLDGFPITKEYNPNGSWHIRIDFIYYKSSSLVPVESVIVDRFMNGKITDSGTNVFPSDHATFITTFEWLD